MPTEPAFAPLSFPAIPGQGGGERDSIRGHAAGYAAGRKQADAEIAELRDSLTREAAEAAERARDQIGSALEALARAAEDYRARQVPVLQSIDASIASAAMELAEVIVGHELATGDGSARTALERATTDAVPAGSVVRLNPQDVAIILADGRTSPGVEIVADYSLDPGDAVIDLSHGSIDARVSASLQRARAALTESAA
ncbi:MAG: hypothetical protein KF761_06920 [Salinibacterium sp.]|nr:hypothetical protein [Salinibacterium sp.]